MRSLKDDAKRTLEEQNPTVCDTSKPVHTYIRRILSHVDYVSLLVSCFFVCVDDITGMRSQ